MIVRISKEGQFELRSSYLDRLNKLDNQVVRAVANDKEEQFQALWQRMLELVRTNGAPLPPEDLRPSDLVLPPEDLTFKEAKEIFVGEGLIPS